MIGSKSPIAYTESYELTTIAEGVQYEYEIVRTLPAPTATLINSFETNKKSGTTVRVEVAETDLFKLHKACERQLVYFDNVIVTNELYYYDNHFKIIEHDLFFVRSDKNYPFSKTMHIVIGQVAYAIDWDLLGLKPIQVPVGIKFDINELEPSLDREKINYKNDKVKNLVIKKIKDATNVLKELYSQGQNITDIPSYMSAIQNPKTVINLAEYDIYYGIQMKDNEYKLIHQGIAYNFGKGYYEELMSAFEVINTSKKGEHSITSVNLYNAVYGEYQYVYSASGVLNHWSSLYRKTYKIIRRRKLTKSIIYKYASVLGLTVEKTMFGKFKRTLQTGAIKKIIIFIKFIEHTLQESLNSYDDVPQSFIDEEKAKQEALKQERKGNITHYTSEGRMSVESIADLMDNYDYVFYLSKAEKKDVKVAYETLFDSFSSNIKKKTKLIIVSPTTINKLKNKVKALTLRTRIARRGKNKYSYNTKNVYAFLSADKVFKYSMLYHQFHKLRYRTQLYMYGYDKIPISGLSSYYRDLGKTLPLSDTFFSQYYNDDNDYVRCYPYLFFKKEIDAIEKKRKPHHEKTLKTLQDVAPKLLALTLVKEDTVVTNQLIKTYKLTKLKSSYYGNF